MDTLTLKALKPLRRWLPCTERLKRLVGERRQGLYVGFAILFLVVLAWCWVRAEARAAPPAAPQGPLQGWTLRFPAPVPDEDFSELERHQALGAPIFLPQGADFMLATHPAGLSGSLKVEDAERWDHAGGELAPQTAGGRFTGRAPQEPGRYRLAWTGDRPGETAALEVLVLARARSRENRLEVGGEVLGPYPDPATAPSESVRDHAERYRPPRLFALLDERSAALPVGPDLDLGQLVAFMEERAPDGRKVLTEKRHTQVLPVCAELYEKLSKLRERLRAQGVKVTRFYITSGFRTPAYNKQVGGAAFSRHCWGDAVDLCIDENRDLKIDDLNGDGRNDWQDGLVIAKACEDLEAEGLVAAGGIGLYDWPGEFSVGSHVHIDCRGFIARWGNRHERGKKVQYAWWRPEDGPAAQAGE